MTTNDHHSEIAARFASLRERIAAGTIARGTWRDVDDAGRERVCLLLALAAEVRSTDEDGVDYEAVRCPAWLLPPWLAEMTPWIDDASSEAAWPAMLQRYADVVGRAALVLDAAAWRRCNIATRRAAVLLAQKQTNDARAIAACDRVVALCNCVLAGGKPTAEEWAAARDRADEAADSAPWTVGAARAAASDWASAAADRAAVWASGAAYGAARAAAADWASGETARAAAADHIIDACLTAIERELAGATRRRTT